MNNTKGLEPYEENMFIDPGVHHALCRRMCKSTRCNRASESFRETWVPYYLSDAQDIYDLMGWEENE